MDFLRWVNLLSLICLKSLNSDCDGKPQCIDFQDRTLPLEFVLWAKNIGGIGNTLYVLYFFPTIPCRAEVNRSSSVLLACEDILFSWSGPPHSDDEVACGCTYLPFLRDKIRVMIHVTRWPYPFLPCPQAPFESFS